MTQSISIIKKGRAKQVPAMLICLIITLLMLIFSVELKESVIRGIRLAALQIIPTLYPFMVLSDLWISTVGMGKESRFASAICRLLKISCESLSALFIGILCGFPLGVKSAVELYQRGAISKNELQRLSPMVNLPSLAFVISGVGLGVYRDFKIGILLYFSLLLSSLIIGALEHRTAEKPQNNDNILRQNFNLVNSIKNAGLSCIAISSYIIFFSSIIGLVTALTKSSLFSAVFSTLLEVGNAVSLIASSPLQSPFRLALIAFALGFSGLSVHFQAFSILPEEISRVNYLIKKMFIGLLSSVTAFSLSFLLN